MRQRLGMEVINPFEFLQQVRTEVSKVTWPTRKETQAATLVVIVTVIISAIILGAFDAVWSFATDKMYG